MDNKIIAVILAIVIVAGGTAAFVALGDDSDEKPLTGSGRLLVYGNADNDDYLDGADVDKIEEIVDSGTWDREEYPFADADHDSDVDSEDVEYLETILEGEEKTKMWYVGSGKIDYYFNYPNTGDIAVTVDYGLMMAQVLDVYDRVVAGTTKCTTYNTDRYPGVGGLLDLGTYKSADYADFQENLMKSGCTIVMGYVAPALYDSLRESGREIDQINLSASAQTQYADMDVVSAILTCGVLLGKADEAREYCAFSDKMEKHFADKAADSDKASFLVAYNPNNPTTISIDTHYPTGGCYGDVWTVSHLPMEDIIEPSATGMTKMDIETICSDVDPDIIIISLWGAAADKDSPESVQELVDEKASYFKTSRAYKNGDIYAVNYESIGSYMGLGALGVLGAYIWPEEYDLDEGWETFYDFVKQFTYLDIDSVDELKQCGGLIVYQMTTA
ncbi:MAG: ABC transporter substrate-binding protein [Candidatus Methanomethylophilaceae archaeon]|nr:ABC transporter substrate-binding protein [Candidatus Methanomethylophilaceae archaeon]